MGISILVFNLWLNTELWIFGCLVGKVDLSELFHMCTLNLAESVNDPNGLYTDNNSGNSSLFKVKDIADL